MTKRRMVVFSTVVLTLVVSRTHRAAAQTREMATVSNASVVLDEVMRTPGKAIPQSLLTKAEGVVIIPNMIKGGFVIGARHGYGVALIRNAQGAWNAPRLLELTGGSVGFQAGVQSTDIILVFMTKNSVQGLLTGKFTIGADAAAAAGPVGRQVAAATDERFKAEIYSYARSRGLFAGVSLDGSAIRLDPNAEAAFYRPAPDGKSSAMPQSAARLLEKVAQYSSSTPAPTSLAAVPTSPVPTSLTVPISHANQTRHQLAAAASKLAKILPANWQAYLASPAEVFSADRHPPLDQLERQLARFNKIAASPQYRVLSEKAEFRQAHRLLGEYLAVLTGKIAGAALELPPVPAD